MPLQDYSKRLIMVDHAGAKYLSPSLELIQSTYVTMNSTWHVRITIYSHKQLYSCAITRIALDALYQGWGHYV